MSTQLAIATLHQYKFCQKTQALAAKYPFEIKRRIAYLDNLTLQLNQTQKKRSLDEILLIADDIRHCLLHNYYPLLPNERAEDNFNFIHTLEDVVQLIELESPVIAAA